VSGRAAAFLCATLVVGCAHGPPLDPVALSARVRATTPRTVVEELRESGGQPPRRWPELIEGVKSGDPAFLELAVQLAPGTDAGATSELRIALFFALRPAPAGTLLALRRASPGPFTVEGVCGADAGIDEAPDRVLELVMARLRTLRDMEDLTLASERDRCLRALEAQITRYR
jgi:hypothetical protein